MSAPILSAFDWEMSNGDNRHLRAGFLDAVNNGKLQYRYVYPDGIVDWRNLIPNLTSVNFNFTSWWSPPVLPTGGTGYGQSLLLFVNGSSIIYEWSGGITTLASTSTTNDAVGTVTTGTPPFGFFLPVAYGGSGYQAGDIVTLSGAGDGNATVIATKVVDGGLDTTSVTINAAGTGYVAGDIVAIEQDSLDKGGTLYIDTVSGGGAITGISLRSQGGGSTLDTTAYTVGTALTLLGGSGSGGKVNIVHIVNGVIQTITIQNGGSGYSPTDAVTTTGGHGSGALVQILTIAPNSITKQGTNTWAQDGFYSHGTHHVVINGVAYQATGGWDSLTLTGVTPDPTGAGVAGDVIHQAVEFATNSQLAGLPSNFQNDLIQTFDQQLYVGSLVSNNIYVSWTDDYQLFTFNIPRFTGQGIILVTQAPPRGFVLQEEQLYVSSGINQWYLVSQDTLDTPLVEDSPLGPQIVPLNVVTPTMKPLKTAGLQGAISQAFMSKNLNDVIYVSNAPVVSSLGRVDNILVTPQISDLSYPIVNDMNGYDLTDGCAFFWQNFIFVAVPKEGLIRMYNMTKDTSTENPTNDPVHYWEAPLTIPISRFSIIDGFLYGHSYLVSETYRLFNGFNFNGHPIPAVAAFAYYQFGVRPQNKSENEYYAEGYISENATLDITINYELDGTGGQYNGSIVGTDSQIVEIQGGQNSLGKESFGKNPLGGDLVLDTDDTNKFRVIKTFPRTPYYEASPVFSSTGIDYIWSLIAFGPAQSPTTEGNNPISQ